jgi:parallel beta-helix repeat protein
MRSRNVLALIAAAALVASSASRAHADSISVGFESPSYTTGSINGQNGWGGTQVCQGGANANAGCLAASECPGGTCAPIPVNGSIDQAVTSADAHSGTQSYRESSAYTSGSFGDQVFGPSLTDRAGEPGSTAAGFAGGTLQPRFTSTMWFKSATGAVQDGHVVISPDRGDGARMSWIQVSDNVADPTPTCSDSGNPCVTNADCPGYTCLADGRHGLSVSFYDYREPANILDCGGGEDAENKCFMFQTVAANLSRNAWHRIDVEMEFYDGKANDVVRVSVDGGPGIRSTSWEDYFPNNQSFQFPTDPPPVDSLLFRVGGSAEGSAGAGFLFDDVTYASTPCQAATRFVATSGDDTFNDCRDSGSPCQTVQHGVDVACVGDTVQVGAGTFAEQVHVPKSLTIVGAGAASTTLLAPASLPSGGDVLQIDGPSVAVDVSAITVSGPGASGCNSINAGIHVMNGAQGNLHDLTVADIRDNPLSGCQNGRGIRVGDSGSPASAVIHNATIVNYQKNGIDVRNAASTVNAHDNVVTGPGATPLIASNGVVVVSAAVSIANNTVSGNECNHASCGADPVNDTQSCGILLIDPASGTAVSGNTISGNDIGVYNSSSITTPISGNQLSGNRYEGILLDQGDAAVASNSVQGGNIGVALISFAGNTGNSSGTLTCNHIEGAGVGIELIDDGGDGFLPVLSGQTNSITGNGTGLQNTTATSQTFKNNWWGCVSGPNNAGCDTVSGPAVIAPVATSVPACVSCNSNADCTDGLACNGVETCNVGTHQCHAGTPVVCLGDQCNNASCVEPSGTCALTAKPDGTVCSGTPDTCSQPDTCQAGTCVDGGGGDPDHDGICSANDNCPTVYNPDQKDLDGDGIGNVCDPADAIINVTQAKLKKDTGHGKHNGLAFAKGDFLTGVYGPDDTFNASSGIGVQIVDNLGNSQTFAWPLAQCITNGSKITCRSADNTSQAKFRTLGTFSNQWRFVIKLKRRGITGPFELPVRVTISHDTGIDRTDDINTCIATAFGIKCRRGN